MGFVCWQVNNFNYERSDLHLLPVINASGGVGRKKKKSRLYIQACVCEREPQTEGTQQKTDLLPCYSGYCRINGAPLTMWPTNPLQGRVVCVCARMCASCMFSSGGSGGGAWGGGVQKELVTTTNTFIHTYMLDFSEPIR